MELNLPVETAFMAAAGALDFSEKDFLRLSDQDRYLMVVMMREFFAGVNVIRDQARQALAPHERLMCLVNEKVMA